LKEKLLKPTFFDTQAHLMVCVDEPCARQGSRQLYQALWRALETENLAYYKRGGNLRLTHSGCLGACNFGPTMACYFKREGKLEEAWYAGMTLPRALELARAVHAGSEPPEQGRFDQ
jgi:(2Fe-2S) ferredoxin